jgi:hypothetical protein
LGLRAENTRTKGTSVSTGQVDNNSYLKLFPTLFVQQALNTDNTVNLSYSYRIGRPNYDMLNPFKWMIDPYTYNIGNPQLQPQFTHSVSLSHSFKGVLITTVGYNYTKDMFTMVLAQNDATKSIFQTMENMSSAIDFNASETFQLPVTKWWRMNGTLTGMYKQVNSQKDGNTTVQLGLRAENTHTKGTSVSTGQVDNNSYLKLFPTLFVQQALNTDNTVNLSYSYRIGRPNYDMLNPFKWMIDPYTYNIGNPQLQPQFTHSVSLSHSFKGALITTVGYNYTKDMFTMVLAQNDATKSISQTMENMSSAIDFNASETFQLPVTKWWRMNGTLTGMYKQVNSQRDGNTTFERWTFMANASSTFSLPFKVDMELSGNYSSKLLIGNFTLRPRNSIDLGFQKKVLSDKGIIRLSFDDIFKMRVEGGYSKTSRLDIDVVNKYDSRRVNLTFSYRFGKDEFKTRGNRQTASSEELNRSGK